MSILAFIAIGLVALVVMAALLAAPRFNGGLYSKMVFAPIVASLENYRANEPAGCKRQDIFFPTAKRCRLHAYWFQVPGSRFTVLFSHSNWGNVDEWSALSQKLVQAGCSVFAYDYQGFGASEGKPTVHGIVQDGLAAYDYLTGPLGVSPESVILFGGSLGTGVSTEIARRRPCAGIILHAPFKSLRALTIKLVPWARFVPNFLFFRPALDNAGNLARIDKPLLLFYGQYDSMVPADHPQVLMASAASSDKRLVVLPRASHMDTSADEFGEGLSTFLSRLSSTAQAV